MARGTFTICQAEYVLTTQNKGKLPSKSLERQLASLLRSQGSVVIAVKDAQAFSAGFDIFIQLPGHPDKKHHHQALRAVENWLDSNDYLD